MSTAALDVASPSTKSVPRCVRLKIDSTAALSLNAWHHLAVVLADGSPYTGSLYVDGVLAGSNAAMTLHPADLGATVHN